MPVVLAEKNLPSPLFSGKGDFRVGAESTCALGSLCCSSSRQAQPQGAAWPGWGLLARWGPAAAMLAFCSVWACLSPLVPFFTCNGFEKSRSLEVKNRKTSCWYCRYMRNIKYVYAFYFKNTFHQVDTEFLRTVTKSVYSAINMINTIQAAHCKHWALCPAPSWTHWWQSCLAAPACHGVGGLPAGTWPLASAAERCAVATYSIPRSNSALITTENMFYGGC